MTASASTFCRRLSRADCSRFFNAVRGSVALLLHRGSLIYALRKLRLQRSGWQEVQWRPRHGTEQSLPEIGTENWQLARQHWRRSSASFGQVEHLAALGVRIHFAPPTSLRFEAFSGEVHKLRACSGDAHAPSAPESAHMASRAASLRFSLCGRVIRCRCLLLANATSGRKLPISRAMRRARRASGGRKRSPEHRLLRRDHAN